jgi:ATP-binding cassette subfamily F protein 3
MIKLLLEPVNLLILDEPSNHLDMKTKDIIKDALRDFDGTLILVSHDRDFLMDWQPKFLSLETNE